MVNTNVLIDDYYGCAVEDANAVELAGYVESDCLLVVNAVGLLDYIEFDVSAVHYVDSGWRLS